MAKVPDNNSDVYEVGDRRLTVDKAFGWTFVPWLDRVDDS